jgi:hypothetical protein
VPLDRAKSINPKGSCVCGFPKQRSSSFAVYTLTMDDDAIDGLRSI